MNAIVAWLVARLKEPSTYVGGGLIATAVHSFLPGALGDSAMTVLQAIGGLAAVVLAEKSAA